MFARLHRASSGLLISTHVHHGARLTFSLSATSFARRPPQRLVGARDKLAAAGPRPRETEDEVEESEEDEESEEVKDKAFNRWLSSGSEEENESGVRSYANPYGHFCKNVAASFREPSSRNWLGRNVPFPLNPSFKPPIPLSDELRSRLYRAYMSDPKLNSVRALAARHHMSMKRVDAILRLKGMEDAWKKNKQLQTGFTRGMEHLLGVTEAASRTEQAAEADTAIQCGHAGESDQPDSQVRYDVEEADLQDEVEGSRARQRYQRLFWESVAEGDEPVMPNILEAERGAALAHTKFKGKTTLVERRPGRPAIMFVDVGNAFVDEREKERREREGARRSMLKARKRQREHASRA